MPEPETSNVKSSESALDVDASGDNVASNVEPAVITSSVVTDVGGGGGLDNEPPMYAQRPSSARSQDVTHILVRTFRDLFTRDAITPDTVKYLETSRCSDDVYHQHYVEALMKVQAEHNHRLAELAMIECHIMQAQARAVSADHREAHRLYAGVKEAYPDVYIPPVQNNFRSCINADFLKQHNLISPSDFSSIRAPVVPPPAASEVPHYAQVLSSRGSSPVLPQVPPSNSMKSSLMQRRPESATEPRTSKRPQFKRQKSLPKLESLWKQQVKSDDRTQLRENLARLQKKVDFLKKANDSSSGGRSLVDLNPKHAANRTTLPLDEISERCKETSQIFVAKPSVVQFTNYEAGQVYEVSLELMNVSSVSRPIRIIPPSTQYFSVSLGQFPSYTSQVAPGLCCVYHVRFIPDALCDFDDVLIVETSAASPLYISLLARRKTPALTLPECLDVGQCLVGGVKVAEITLRNKGGPGWFCVMATDDWPNPSFKGLSTLGALQLDDVFEVKPVMFQVTPEQPSKLTVLFTPTSCGDFSQSLTIACDNCHVRHITITGKGVKPCVELVSASDCLCRPGVGELCDITAQYFLSLPALNPCTYTQRLISIKNSVDVELQYYWIFVKPVVRVNDPTDQSTPIVPTERMQDIDSVFSIEPEAGILPPNKTASFLLTFAPAQAGQYHNALHFVLQYMQKTPVTSQGENTDSDALPRAPVSSTSSSMDPIEVEQTALELDVKGCCVPYSVVVEPSAFFIPGQVIQGTVLKKKFKMINNSQSSISFTWDDVASWYVLHVEPAYGDLPARCEMVFDLSLSATQSGQIEHQLLCHLDWADDAAVSLLVNAMVKGAQLSVDEPDLDFGLMRLGESRTLCLTLRNAERSPLEWSINESELHAVGDGVDEFAYSPRNGVIAPLGSQTVEVTFSPRYCRSVRNVLEVVVKDGCAVVVAAVAEVQSPVVCLLRSSIELRAFIDVPVSETVTLYNQTACDAVFRWAAPCGGGASLADVQMEPSSGTVRARDKLDVTVTLTPRVIGQIADLLLPCVVEDMIEPVCLSISASVGGLSVTYSVSDDPSGTDAWLTGDDVCVDFGDDVPVGTTPSLYLRIRNDSGIGAAFRVGFDNFASLMTPPDHTSSHSPDCPQSRPLLKATVNLADRSPLTPAQAQAKLSSNMLHRKLGVAFDAVPMSGWLQPFGDVVIKISAYSDMWGTYVDRLNCYVDSLDVVTLPVTMTVTGCPVFFQMVSHDRQLSPILRFGEAADGSQPIAKRACIVNSSSVDIRFDWQTFNANDDRDKVVDLIAVYGRPFPIRDGSGNEVISHQPVTREAVDEFISSKPKVVSLKIRERNGHEATHPFCIQPSQFVIPAYSRQYLNVTFTPSLPDQANSSPSGIDYVSYALGYMSLKESDAKVEGLLCRLSQYDVSPLKLHMTGHVAPATVDIECHEDDEDCLNFKLAASELLLNHQPMLLKTKHVMKQGISLTNKHASPVTLSLSCDEPFGIDCDRRQPSHQAKAEATHQQEITLTSHQNVAIHVEFCLTPDLLHSSLQLSELERCDSIQLETGEIETVLRFRQHVCVEYRNRSRQLLPVEASVFVPCFTLSEQIVNFGTCLVGQTRELEVVLSNPSRSSSVWQCCCELKSANCSDETFVVTPSNGMLEAQFSTSSQYKTILHVYFTAAAAEQYEATYVISGILGEQPIRLQVCGNGSYDGQFEAVVNI